jgi:hypothetical protein
MSTFMLSLSKHEQLQPRLAESVVRSPFDKLRANGQPGCDES